MTCIVGYVDKKTKTVYLGADRGIFIDDSELVISNFPKILSKDIGEEDRFIMGICGDHYFCDRLESLDYTTIKITKTDEKSPAKFLKSKFVPFLRENISSKEVGNSSFLIGIFGKLFWIDSEFSVIDPPGDGIAIGSAGTHARGALYALNQTDNKLTAEQKILKALEIAEQCSTYCRGPFDILGLS